MTEQKSYLLCGIGGSGMLPLALILKERGHVVCGSDRSYDQGRTPDKFHHLQECGIALYPQDGSGVSKDTGAVVVSSAVEDTVPDVHAARERNIPVVKRSELLSALFNDTQIRIAVAGTSGKTTVTGMIGYVLKKRGLDPTVMNGGVFKNYQKQNPYCSAFAGKGDVFVTEADESDGSIALYNPGIAVLNNIALDHKTLEELNVLFADFIAKAETAVLNADHDGVMALPRRTKKTLTYGIKNEADIKASGICLLPGKANFNVEYRGKIAPVSLPVPGEHNVMNALAAIGACLAAGQELHKICETLSGFQGIWRRLDTVGCKNEITVIDDFAHNPDKIAASLKTLKQAGERLRVFFQPHGFGFLKLTYRDLAKTFAGHLSSEDRLVLVQPYYAGGTVDRSIDSTHIVAVLKERGIQADLAKDRTEVKTILLSQAKAGDQIVIMGARDDTLSDFAKEIYDALP